MKRLILVGYMGAGKTTVGRALAKHTGLQFYDLDWYIESRMHAGVGQLFSEKGETAFREIERKLLHEVAEFENVVVSCGGGTPCYFDNMQYMNRQGTTVYLRASIPVLLQHLRMARVPRPLLQGKTQEELEAFMAAHIAEREPFYLQATHVVDLNVLDTRESIDSIVEQIANLPIK